MMGSALVMGSRTKLSKTVLRFRLVRRKDYSHVIKHALILKFGTNRGVEEFVEMAANAYHEAGFNEGQEIMNLFNSALIDEDIESFVVQKAPSTFAKIGEVLLQHQISSFRFRKINENGVYTLKRDVRNDHLYPQSKNTSKSWYRRYIPTVEELSAQLAKLSLTVKKEDRTASGFRDIRTSGVESRFGDVLGQYCKIRWPH